MTSLCRTLIRRALCVLPAALTIALGAGAAPAGAVLVPNTTSPQWSVMPMEVGTLGSPAGVQSPLADTNGGPVLGGTHVYLIYWDPSDPPTQWPIVYPQSTKLLTALFLQDLSGDSGLLDNPFAVDTQYYSNGVPHAGNTVGTAPGFEVQFAGSYTDQIGPFPANGCVDPNTTGTKTDVCLTDAQIQTALQNYVTEYALPTGPTNVYLMLTPPDVTTCLTAAATECSDVLPSVRTSASRVITGGYCGYHSVIGSGASEIIYGQIPWLYPNIANADAPGAIPDATALGDLKDCQPDGNSVVGLPNAPNEYAAQPLISGEGAIEADFGDVTINVISHVLNGIITDPNLNGWYDAGGLEAPDKCEAAGSPPNADPGAWYLRAGGAFGSLTLPYGVGMDNAVNNYYNTTFTDADDYYLQSEFNAAEQGAPAGSAGTCDGEVQLTPNFPIPAHVDPNQLVGFDSSSTIPTLDAHQYTWNFGDGSPNAVVTCTVVVEQGGGYPCDPSTFHAFTSPGTYNVALTVQDLGGNTATVTKPINVLGTVTTTTSTSSSFSTATISTSTSTSTAATSAVTTSSTATTTTTTSTSASATSTATPASVPPKVTQSIVASSVSKALKSGLNVHYSVTERVAGHFQVLIDARTAKSLHITGPIVRNVTVAGLSNPVQIGTALLEATKAGSDGIAITFSKAVAAKLRQARTLSLTVRIVAVNIAGQQVVTTTTVKLH